MKQESKMTATSEPHCLMTVIFIFNTIMTLFGIIVVLIGSVCLLLHSFISFVLIGIGSAIAFVAIFGCVALVARSKTMLKIFSAFLFLVLLVEIAATVLAVEKGQVVTESLETGLKDEMFAYNRNTSAARVIDLLQSQLKCCGSHAPTDWVSLVPGWTVPVSCCVDKKSCNRRMSISSLLYYEKIYRQGCIETIFNSFTKDNRWNLIGPLIGIAVFQILLVMLALLTSFMLGVVNRVVPDHAKPSSSVPI